MLFCKAKLRASTCRPGALNNTPKPLHLLSESLIEWKDYDDGDDDRSPVDHAVGYGVILWDTTEAPRIIFRHDEISNWNLTILKFRQIEIV